MAFHIVVAFIWSCACVSMAISWAMNWPFGTGAKLTLAYAMAFVLVTLSWRAFLAIEAFVDRRRR